MRQVASLTGLRGAAAVWVMLYHVFIMAPAVGAGWIGKVGFLPAGWIGVDLFFVLSGFILMWTHGAELARPSASAIARFAGLRLARVYPVSLAVLVLIALLVWADPGFAAWAKARNPDNFSLAAFVRTAALATRWYDAAGGDWNQPVWSLSVEMVGYAFFPLLAWGIAARSAGMAILIAATGLVTLALFQVSAGIVGLNTIDQISALVRMACGFIAGMALCRARQVLSDRGAAVAPAAALVICGALAVCAYGKAGLVLAPSLFAALIFALSFQTGAVARWLSSPPLMFLGRISFPLYLVHLTPLRWLVSHTRQAGLGEAAATGLLVAYVAISLGAAYLLHRLVEQPVHRWARRGFALSWPAISSSPARS